MATLVRTTIDDTSFLRLPVGTTAQRPVSPEVGMLRFNSSTNKFEFYSPSGWQNVSPPDLIGTGGSITTSGNFNTHTFTSSGTFEIVEQ